PLHDALPTLRVGARPTSRSRWRPGAGAIRARPSPPAHRRYRARAAWTDRGLLECAANLTRHGSMDTRFRGYDARVVAVHRRSRGAARPGYARRPRLCIRDRKRVV